MHSERDLGRVARVGQRQHLAVDEQGVAADLDGAIAAAWMESYLIWRARYSALLDALTSFALTSGSLMAPRVTAVFSRSIEDRRLQLQRKRFAPKRRMRSVPRATTVASRRISATMPSVAAA